MTAASPLDLFFGGMEKLGPGSDADTLHVLHLLPRRQFHVIVDAGCGAGRQTLVLARALATPIHAVDTYQPFLDALERRANETHLAHLVRTQRMDMSEIPAVFPHIGLLWSEGAAYNIGFAHALRTWAAALDPGGCAVVSELSWLHDDIPHEVADFFAGAYPEMRSVPQNITLAEAAGYRVLTTHTLPREAWVDGYYDVLGPRAEALRDHPDAEVRAFAADTLKEIELFQLPGESYGYIFYVLERV